MLDTVNKKWVSINHLSIPRAYGGAVCPVLWDNSPLIETIYTYLGGLIIIILYWEHY